MKRALGEIEEAAHPSNAFDFRHTHLSLTHPLAFSVVLDLFLSLDTGIGSLLLLFCTLESSLNRGD